MDECEVAEHHRAEYSRCQAGCRVLVKSVAQPNHTHDEHVRSDECKCRSHPLACARATKRLLAYHVELGPGEISLIVSWVHLLRRVVDLAADAGSVADPPAFALQNGLQQTQVSLHPHPNPAPSSNPIITFAFCTA